MALGDESAIRQRITSAFNAAYPRWRAELAAREWDSLPVAFDHDGPDLLEMILTDLAAAP